MAKFSETFLQGLLQPSYQQGLFTAAQQIGAAPAKRRMQEQLATATPEQRFDIAIAQLTRAGELEKAAKLEANKAKFIADRQVAQDKLITNVVSGQMVASGSTEVPSEVAIGGKSVAIPSRLQSDILEATNTLQNRRDGRETAMKEGELTDYYINYVNNSSILKENPQVVDAFNKLNNPESGLMRTEKNRLVKNIMTAVDEEVDRQFGLRTGEKAAKIRINNLIDDIEKAGTNTWWWGDDDMADALEGMSDSEKNTFIDQAALYYQINPNATQQELIDVGMSGMRKLIPGQEQSEAITAAEKEEAAENEAIIQAYMQRDGLTRKEAIDKLKSDKLGSAIFSAGKAIATGGNLSVTGGN